MLLADAVRTLLLREKSPMPITRRRRANPPDEPENNNHVGEQTENAEVAQSIELNWSLEKVVNAAGSKERFERIADVPANNHVRGYTALHLHQAVSGQNRQQ